MRLLLAWFGTEEQGEERRNRGGHPRGDAGQCVPWHLEHATSGMDVPGGFQGKGSYHSTLLGPLGHDQRS